MKDNEWLEIICNTDNISSRAKYHSDKSPNVVSLPSLNADLPIISKPVHTLETQYHCMKITKETINFLNPRQTAVDT